jgi:NADPH-dependent glutamate synthase beta subunit-like oxidoreductase
MIGNVTGAARTILAANILGASCARVCPTEVLCEGACVMLDRDRDPIKIGRLQRYATDHVSDNRIEVQTSREKIPQTRRRDVGQQKQSAWLQELFPELEMNRNGSVVRDLETGRTSVPKVFTGGDCANGGREVVNAVGEGKKAARGIHQLFGEAAVVGPVQLSRWGVACGPFGSDLDAPIPVSELQ